MSKKLKNYLQDLKKQGQKCFKPAVNVAAPSTGKVVGAKSKTLQSGPCDNGSFEM